MNINPDRRWLIERVEFLEKALVFYAIEAVHQDSSKRYWNEKGINDRGNVARQALVGNNIRVRMTQPQFRSFNREYNLE